MAPKSKDKGKPPPASSQPPPAIEDLFTKLNSHIEGSSDPNIEQSELEKAVKVANQVLSIAPGDEDALRCKVVALIKNDRYDDALSTIHSARKLQFDFNFEEAYCLYKQNKLDEALVLLKGQEGNSETMLLEAQILFRLGRMDACIDVYQNLRKSKLDSLEINLAASLILAGRSSEMQSMLDGQRIKPSSSYDLVFNTACSLVETKKYVEAEQLLQQARRICQESLLDANWAEEDIEIELAPIAVQLAYVQQLLGRSQEAVEAYTEIINPNLADDLSSLSVAVNNLVAERGPKEVSDSLKKLELLKEQGITDYRLASALDKLSPKQRETIYANRLLLLIHANKMDQARELVSALPGMFADSEMPVLLQAAVLVREKKAARAEEILDQFAEKFPLKSKVALLARAQIAAASGHQQIAADSLSRIPDIQHMPATVATLVALKERAGDIDGASAVLDSAVKWWTNAMSENSKLSVIMQEAAAFKVKHGQEADAARLFEELVTSHGSTDALVGLVSTIAHVDIDKAEAYKKKLKPLPGLNGIDVDSLEKTSGAKPIEGGASRVPAAEESKKEKQQKKKRKRKPRYPKGFDPANPGPPPDPERWLPKRERSSYRPKRKDKRAGQVRGSQGAVAREKNEAAASASASSSAAATTSSSNASKAASSSSKSQNANNHSSKSSKKKSRR